jgi:hypothetical protein
VLFGTYGVVLRLSDEEKKEFEAYVKELSKRNRVLKNLVVHERTYKVAHYSDSFQSIEEAYDSTATRYFYLKVNVSNADERILAMLLTGLTFNDLYSMAKTRNVEGLPRDMTIQSLNKFATRYGNTPDIFQMAITNLAGNIKGYFAPKVDLQDVADRVEADTFQCDFNEKMYEKEATIARTQKLPTLGGAIAAIISVDVYSGYVHGHLAKNLANQIDHVRRTVETYRQEKKSIKLFAADQGIITQSQFQVFVFQVQT